MPQIDYGKCVFCGLCVDACPFYALFMTNDYELSSFTKEHLIYTPAQLSIKPKYSGDVEIKEDPRRKAAGIVLLLVFIGGLGAVVLASGLGNPAFTKFNKPAIDVATIGKQMVTYYAPVLVLLGLTLAASVIGALALARRED